MARYRPARTTCMSMLAEVPPANTPPTRKNKLFIYTGQTEKSKVPIDYEIRYNGREKPAANPILVVPGLMAVRGAYNHLAMALAQRTDRPVATMLHGRREKGLPELSVAKLFHPDRIGAQSVVAMIDELRARYGAKKVTLVGHSMGGTNAVDGVLRRLDCVDQVLLVNSGGLEAGQNIVRMATRMPGATTEEIIPGMNMLQEHGNTLKTAGRLLCHAAQNPWLTGNEVLAVSNRGLMAGELQELATAGIGCDGLFSENDHFFPPDRAVRDASPFLDAYTVMPGVDHYAPIKDPLGTADCVNAHLQSHQLRISVA